MCLSANLYSCRGRLQVSQGLEVFELFEHIPKLIQLLLAGLSCHVLLRFSALVATMAPGGPFCTRIPCVSRHSGRVKL